MGKRLRLRLGNIDLTVVLNETATAAGLAAAAPFDSRTNRWGQELYFGTPASGEASEATASTVRRGEVGFWPPGRAMCLFFGPTPLSVGDEIRPASPVAVVGWIDGGEESLAALDQLGDGLPVTVTADGPTSE